MSAKLEVPPGGFDEHGRCAVLQDRINAYLPPDVRVFSVCKVTQKFRPRECCNWREYEYLLPRQAFDSEEALDLLQAALGEFVGTHDFVNFCKAGRIVRRMQQDAGRRAGWAQGDDDHKAEGDTSDEALPEDRTGDPGEGEPSEPNIGLSLKTGKSTPAIRGSIYRCEVADRAMIVAGEPMVRIVVLGQAFFYNQIRQMVGASIGVARGHLPLAAMKIALELPVRVESQWSAPLFAMAPGQGLLLVDSGFDRHPRMAIATDETRAAALAAPPNFVMMSSTQAKECDAFKQELRARCARAWFRPEPSRKEGTQSTSLLEGFLARCAACTVDEDMVRELEVERAKWAVSKAASEATKAAKEASRRESADLNGHRAYRNILPSGMYIKNAMNTDIGSARVLLMSTLWFCKNSNRSLHCPNSPLWLDSWSTRCGRSTRSGAGYIGRIIASKRQHDAGPRFGRRAWNFCS